MTYLDKSNIPEEYKEQIAQLIESNDETNWELVCQLIKGWYEWDIVNVTMFNLMMYYYQHIRTHGIELDVASSFILDHFDLLDKIRNYADRI